MVSAGRGRRELTPYSEDKMVREIESYEECREFVENLRVDPDFGDPMLATEEQLRQNLLHPIESPDSYRVVGVFEAVEAESEPESKSESKPVNDAPAPDNAPAPGRLTGVFAFLRLPDERYAEMLVGLSRRREAYAELFAWLRRDFRGYEVDFVFNPRNCMLRDELRAAGAQFEPEQQKMRLCGEAEQGAGDVEGSDSVEPAQSGETARPREHAKAANEPAGGFTIEPFCERYAAQYAAIHSTDVYWTADRVMAAQDRFRILLAVRDGEVIGYIDVTRGLAENEPYDLYVLPAHRRRGCGRALLAAAIRLNRPRGMMLLVDVDNPAAVRLYETSGFCVVSGENSLTAHMVIPA